MSAYDDLMRDLLAERFAGPPPPPDPKVMQLARARNLLLEMMDAGDEPGLYVVGEAS